jgi:hypothetical protein
LEKKRKGIVVHIIPLERIPFHSFNNMRNRGKVAVVHILFPLFVYSFFYCLAVLPFPSSSIRRLNDKRRYRTLVFK